MGLAQYEGKIDRDTIFKFRSKRLDAVIDAIDRYLSRGSLRGLEEIESAVAKWRQEDPKEYADRGRPNEVELANDIRLEGAKWGWGAGRIRLVDPTSNPRYEPHLWNDNGRIQNSTNCYAYACNDPYNHAYDDKPQPGTHFAPSQSLNVLGATNARPIVLNVTNHRFNTGTLVEVWGVDGNTKANGKWVVTNVDANHFSLNNSVGNGAYLRGGRVRPSPTNEGVRLQVMLDDQNRNFHRTQRLVPLIRLRKDIQQNTPIDVANVSGYYLIALVVARGVDYHWYRQDDTGLWSHKPGHTKARNTDESGKPIVDPRECNLGIYSFTNFYYAPKGGVRTASLGDWTNPDWHY